MNVKQVEPSLGRRERKYVKDCLKRRWITEGKYAELFLDKIKEYTGAKYAVLAPNGTLAIYMALYCLGIKRGDRVIVPDLTFNASASPLHFLGATPVFCDVDISTFQIDVDEARKLIEDDPKIRAIIPVHLYGQSADMNSLMKLATDEDLIVMEDAAQGLGVFYETDTGHVKSFELSARRNEEYNIKTDTLKVPTHVGTFGEAGIFAFFSDKNVIMGEGGVVVTNDEGVYIKLKYLRNQGRFKSGSFEHESLGMNFRITDMQCAVGYAQMERINELAERKRFIYNYCKICLEDLIKNGRVKLMDINANSNHVPLRFPILVNDKKKVMTHLEKNGIQTRSLEYPLHRNPCWEHLHYEYDAFPHANHIYEHGIKLPIHNSISLFEAFDMCEKIREAL